MKKFILLYLLFLNATAIYPQGKSITFSHLTTDDGLSQISVNSLYVDERGVIWIGTREGLNCYNGNDIKTYKLQKNNSNSLFSNPILRITGNQEGKIYLLCSDGVAEFNLTTEKFSTLLQGSVNSIVYKKKLYIGKRNEIYVFNPQTQNFDLHYQLPGKDIITSSLHIDTQDNLWIGTENKGVYKLDRNKQATHPIETGNITSIYQDTAGELWIGSWEEGLYRIQKDGSIQNLQSQPENPYSLSSNFVRACCEDNAGNIWIGTFKGLNRYDKQTGQFESYTEGKENTEGLTHPSIWCIVKDQQGTLWMGTYFGGVNYFHPEYEIYTWYKPAKTEQKGLSSPIVGRMIEDKSGNLWICTEGGGINVYDRKSRTFRWFRQEEGRNSLSHNNVKAIYYDEKNEIMWIGTHLGGLNRLELRTNRFTHYRMKENDPTSLPSDIIRDIIPYRNQLVIGTQNGVCLFDPQTEHCQQLFKGIKEGQTIKMVADLFMDKDSTLWITSLGVHSYRFDTQRLKSYRHHPEQPNSLSSNSIYSIMQDSQGNLWFSTSGSGLDLYRPQTDDFENFDIEKSGLSSNSIYKVCESSVHKGQLLLITNQGFSLFDYPKRVFRNFSKANGFPLTAVNENALYITRDGDVFLGGVQGMVSFHEKRLSFTPKPYNIILARLTVNGKEVNPGDETNILQQALNSTREITLKADQSMFSIEYATSNFIPANQDEIIYRLEGFSNEWNSMPRKQTTITYTNLSPGKYTLVIKAQNKGIEEARLSIQVLPPWYRTWWAELIYILITSGLLWYLIQTYKSRIKLRESLKYEKKHTEDIEALNQSKLRFFTNISHEFRTPLTLIVGQVESLLQTQAYTPAIYNKILGIYKNSLQLRELITELLDFRKQEQGHMKIKVSQHNLVNFLYENYLLFLEYASSKNISFNFHKAENDIEIWYDQKQMQKVVNNLLSNALKHTKEGDTISIHVRVEENLAIIRIQDTGIGIKASEVDKIFDRFYQVEQAEAYATVAGVGTGIGLALTKGIIELHRGTIWVESELGKGSCFIVSLQLGNEHFNPEEISLKTDSEKQSELLQAPGQLPLPTEEQNQSMLEEEAPYKPIPGAKMLIVEDNEAIREMLIGIFGTFYEVITATDGAEGLEKVHSEMPNIVLSDVVMPRMSGTELCKEIKKEFNTCHIPVVLLTARTAVEHNLEGLRTGADDYVTKPFNTHILISRCNNLVNSRLLLQEKFSRQPQAFAQMLATNPMDKEMLDRAVGIIEKYLDAPDFNVNTFAREMGMARTNLFTKLKGVTGQTPNDFILTIRLKKGAVMLRNNQELNISEISDKIGFSSSRYFSKCFKDMYHVSPMSYRKGEDSEEEDT